MLSPKFCEALTSAGWIWPAYIRNGVVYKLAEELLKHPVADRPAVLEKELPKLYAPEDLAVMLLERYRKVPIVSDYQAVISEAIEAAHLGLFHVAVAALFPVIEGILRIHASGRGGDLGDGTGKLASELDEMIKVERTKHPGCSASAERISMLEIYRDFLTGTLLRNTKKFVGERELNRHGILHGVFRDFGHEANFYILISVLDVLTFILTYRTSGISVLAPDFTAESRGLANYYRTLQMASAAGPKVKARV